MSQISVTEPNSDLHRTEGKSLAWWFGTLVGVPLLIELVIILGTGNTERFLWLCFQAAEWPLFIRPLSVPLLTWLYFGWSSCQKRGEMGSLRLLWLAPLIVLPLTMLFWGTLFYNPDHYSGNYHRGHLVFLLAISLITFIAILPAIVFNHGRNSFVIPFSLLMVLNDFFCGYMACSAVSGEWH